jgi:VIT1/CCC1 family predicted Fe2+/Mn2+ transporter
VLEAQGLPEEEASPARHGAATFAAFLAAGSLPLLPYIVEGHAIDRFVISIALAYVALFAVGAARALISTVRWWTGGAEMLGLGALVTAAAYASGALVARLVA